MMSHSRKQLRAQIAMTNRLLHCQQSEVIAQKSFIQYHRRHYVVFLIATLLVPALWLGWKMSGEKWVDKMARQLVDVVTLAFFSYFRRQLMNFLK